VLAAQYRSGPRQAKSTQTRQPRYATSHFRFPCPLQQAGSGSGKSIKKREQRTINYRAHAQYFTTLPTVAAGFQLRSWKSGPRKGTPKLPQAAQSLLDRGLLRLDETARLPCLFFTPEGLAALRCMRADPRLANPQKFAHIRRELGLDRDYGAVAAE
jgi:hypothetical protein